jgi:S-adenosylmethionine:tRNA ribosyltransferase-isomerase
MKDPRLISIDDYTYDLPENRIPLYPLPVRDSSKLLIYKEGLIGTDEFKNLTEHIDEHSLLVFNNTKVVAARILFQKHTGGVIEIFCLEPAGNYPDVSKGFAQHGKVVWNCLVGGASKWKPGQVLEKIITHQEQDIILQARFVEKKTDSFNIEFSWTPVELSFADILHASGSIPLPPYIKRKAEEKDAETYQTIYAKREGSVAAPTAGLHFTPNIFESLRAKHVTVDYVTLHVGAGTFKPVKSTIIADHKMHGEWIDVEKQTIKNIIAKGDKKLITVGTTSLRTIESLYWMGVKSIDAEPNKTLSLEQWEAYELEEKKITVNTSLIALLEYMTRNKLERLMSKTEILIAPGYRFKIVDGLITNFHQPKSTLLLLVAALVGEDWKKIYEYALKNEFRFLSYGDGSLLWKKSNSSSTEDLL